MQASPLLWRRRDYLQVIRNYYRLGMFESGDEFENMYRTADDLKRNTKESVEIYGITGQLAGLKDILNAFVTNTNAAA